MQNPKMIGSNLVSCVPQGLTRCPNNCSNCWYNISYYCDVPHFPTEEGAFTGDLIVRVNDGLDSNIHRNLVIESTAIYPHRFYNTSQERFDFPAPVMYTCNGSDEDHSAIYTSEVDNLTAVRVRVNTWNVEIVKQVVDWYTKWHQVPVLLTFMRYKWGATGLIAHIRDYEVRKHVVNTWWDIRRKQQKAIMDIWADNDLVFTCGTLDSNLCKDCGNCERLYWRKVDSRWHERINHNG